MQEEKSLSSKKKFPGLPGIFTLFVILEVGVIGCTSFKNYKQDAEKLCNTDAAVEIQAVQSNKLNGRNYPLAGEIITAEHLLGLPEIVQRYLNESGVIGQTMVSTVQLRQTGKIRTAPEASWMKFKAVEIYNIELSEFLWYADVKMNPFLWLTGYDRFQNGHGEMKIKIYG